MPKRAHKRAPQKASDFVQKLPAKPVAIADLKPHPRNYKTHPPRQLEHIAESLKRHGFYRNVVAARDLTLLAGHGVVEAAKMLGWKTAPVVHLDLDPLDPLALSILAGDNELGKFAETDDRMLTEILREISADPTVGPLGTGFDPAMLANLVMVTRPMGEVHDLSAAQEWVGMPEYNAGEDQYKVIVTFASQADRDEFVKEKKLKVSATKGKVLSMRWPLVDEQNPMSLRFQQKKKKTA